jgi:large subunit ribosomal protein L15e
MGLIKYLKLIFKSDNKEYKSLMKDRLIQWRSETTPLVIDRPTNLATARKLGYKAKPGIVLVRVRLFRGQQKRPSIRHGRRSAHLRQRLVLKKSYQVIAEQRANKNYPNLEVLNSYKAGKDGLHYWYEVIMIDPYHPVIRSDKNLSWICSGKHIGRINRGLTSAAKKSRGLGNKGQGSEKVRPSIRANNSRAK